MLGRNSAVVRADAIQRLLTLSKVIVVVLLRARALALAHRAETERGKRCGDTVTMSGGRLLVGEGTREKMRGRGTAGIGKEHEMMMAIGDDGLIIRGRCLGSADGVTDDLGLCHLLFPSEHIFYLCFS